MHHKQIFALTLALLATPAFARIETDDVLLRRCSVVFEMGYEAMQPERKNETAFEALDRMALTDPAYAKLVRKLLVSWELADEFYLKSTSLRHNAADSEVMEKAAGTEYAELNKLVENATSDEAMGALVDTLLARAQECWERFPAIAQKSG